MHSLMYKRVADAQYRSKLSNELMMYHMKVPRDQNTDKQQSLVDLHFFWITVRSSKHEQIVYIWS